MSMIVLIIILLLLFGGGGGYYGYRSGWYGQPGVQPGTPGPGFNPMAIIWILVVIILIVWLVNELGVIRIFGR